MKLENSVVDGRKHRRAGILSFFPASLRKRLFPDFFGKGGNTFLVDGLEFFRGVSFLVLCLFHIVIVARRDVMAGVPGRRTSGI